MPLRLAPLPAAGPFDAREEGVADLLDSNFRFFEGGAFFIVVAVPFLVFDGAGRFLEAACCGSATSVVGTGTDDSRNGDCVRRPCSFFSEATALTVCCSILRESTGEEGWGVGTASSLIAAGEEAISSTADVVERVESTGGEVFVVAAASEAGGEFAEACAEDEATS